MDTNEDVSVCGDDEDDEEHLLNDANTASQEIRKSLSSGRTCCSRWRYVTCALTFSCLFVVTCQRVAFNICLVAMVNGSRPTNHSSQYECPPMKTPLNNTHSKEGEFNWNTRVESQLMAAFFYGYVITQLPGGYLSDRFGPRLVLGVCGALSGILTFLTPFIAYIGPKALVASRVIVGLAQGPVFPAHTCIWGKWAPQHERSRLFGFSYTGSAVGFFVGIAGAGVLSNTSFLGGWPSPLFISGILSFIWIILWIVLASDSPGQHKFISDHERRLIETSIWKTEPPGYSDLPWRQASRSGVLWAMMVYYFIDGVAFYGLFTSIPVYFKNVLHFDMSQNGILSGIPYLVSLFVACGSAPVADWIIKTKCLSITATRKLFTVLGELPVTPFLVAMSLAGCNHFAASALYITSLSFNGFTNSGAYVIVLDFAPRYAGTLMGIISAFGNLGGFLAPVSIGLIVKNAASLMNWRIVFFATAALAFLKVVIFSLFASSEKQPWAFEIKEEDLQEASANSEPNSSDENAGPYVNV